MMENQGRFIYGANRPYGCTLVAGDNFVVLLYCPPMSANTYFIHKRNKKTVQES